MNLRILATALCALSLMVVMTVCLGPGVGVEANCVSLQTTGKTVMVVLRDAAIAVRAIPEARWA